MTKGERVSKRVEGVKKGPRFLKFLHLKITWDPQEPLALSHYDVIGMGCDLGIGILKTLQVILSCRKIWETIMLLQVAGGRKAQKNEFPSSTGTAKSNEISPEHSTEELLSNAT